MFPTHRLRRMRRTESSRRLLRETHAASHQLIYPLLVIPGSDKKESFGSLPGVYRFSVDRVGEEAAEAAKLGIGAIMLFGDPDKKDEEGSQSYGPGGTVHRAIRAIKRDAPDMMVITDVCLCRYTDHGHCGIFELGEVQNDATLEIMQRIAVSHAQAGADMVAPSAMMDGQVLALRQALDEAHFEDVGIMACSAVYASAFNASIQPERRKEYQMDPANTDEALREIALDIEEGADVVAIKPAMIYLDVVRRVKETFQMPVAAYHADGEVRVVKAAAEKGWVKEKDAVLEILSAIQRAGANMVITSYAKDVAMWLAMEHKS